MSLTDDWKAERLKKEKGLRLIVIPKTLFG